MFSGAGQIRKSPSNLFQVTKTEIIYMQQQQQHMFQPGLHQPLVHRQRLHPTLHVVVPSLLASTVVNSEASSSVPASLSRTCTVTVANSNAHLWVTWRTVLLPEEFVQLASLVPSYTHDTVALKIKSLTKQQFYCYQFKTVRFGKVPLLSVCNWYFLHSISAWKQSVLCKNERRHFWQIPCKFLLDWQKKRLKCHHVPRGHEQTFCTKCSSYLLSCVTYKFVFFFCVHSDTECSWAFLWFTGLNDTDVQSDYRRWDWDFGGSKTEEVYTELWRI